MKTCKALDEITTQLTVEARIRVKEFSNEWMPIVYKGGSFQGIGRRSYTLWVNKRGYVHFTSAPKDSFRVRLNSLKGSIRRNRLHHVAAIIDTTAGKMLLYLDGQIVDTGKYGRRIRRSRLPLLLGWTHEYNKSYSFFSVGLMKSESGIVSAQKNKFAPR